MVEKRINIIVNNKKAIGWTGIQGYVSEENMHDPIFSFDIVSLNRAVRIASSFYPYGTAFIEEVGKPATLEGVKQGR